LLGSGNYNAFVNFVSSNRNDLARYGANLGLGEQVAVEVGLTVWAPEGHDTEVVANAKLQLPMQQRSRGRPFSLAVGVLDISDEIARTPYLSYTTELGTGGVRARPIYGTVGLGANDGKVLDGLLLGAATPLTEQAWLMVEFDAQDLNAGVRFLATPQVTADAAVVNDDFGLAVAYNVYPK